MSKGNSADSDTLNGCSKNGVAGLVRGSCRVGAELVWIVATAAGDRLNSALPVVAPHNNLRTRRP